jgi:hypothetical protein
MLRLTSALALAGAILIGAARPAAAGGAGGAYTGGVVLPGPSSGAYTDTSGAGSSAANDGEPGEAGGHRSSRPSRCTYEYVDAADQDTAERMWGPSPGGPGSWGRKICYDDLNRSSATIVWLPRRADPRAMADRAEQYLPLPAPQISTSPAADHLLVVGLPTWLWVDPSSWKPLSSTVSVTGVTVTVTAVPERVVWQTGDGQTVVCRGPSRAYDPAIPDEQQSTDCSHVYRQTSETAPGHAFQLTATTEWRVSWTVSGATGGGDLGVVRRTSAPVPVRVGEVQTVNVASQER